MNISIRVTTRWAIIIYYYLLERSWSNSPRRDNPFRQLFPDISPTEIRRIVEYYIDVGRINMHARRG